ncbi:hypothetical protein L1887_29456 [Cichorium endivia]|nr:hypothetical protein L1887_29456 [Cichorium endivia]
MCCTWLKVYCYFVISPHYFILSKIYFQIFYPVYSLCCTIGSHRIIQIARRDARTRENLPPRLSTRSAYKYVKACPCIIHRTFLINSCTFPSHKYLDLRKFNRSFVNANPPFGFHIFSKPPLYIHFCVSGDRSCLSAFLR